MKKKQHIFCFRCRFHSGQCICEKLSKVPSKIRWTIIMHHREFYLSSNTGRLGENTLENCKIILRGLPNTTIDWENIINENESTFLLFPADNAIEISTKTSGLCKSKPIHIIVPDGSWRQASKVYKREKSLKNIPCLKLPSKNYQSNYLLRKAPHENYLCTYEAMSKVVEEIESVEFAKKMKYNLKVLVSISLKNRKHCLPNYLKGKL